MNDRIRPLRCLLRAVQGEQLPVSWAPLVLLHTVRTQAEHFRFLIPMVSDHYTVYALDLPGMGYSEIVIGASYQEPEMRAGVERLLTELDLHDVTLVGESMGAVLALTAAADMPERYGASWP